MAAAAAPADASAGAEDGVVAERAGGGVAFSRVLHRRSGGVLPAVPPHAGAAMGAGGDRILCAESKSAVSLHHCDDGASVPGAADLDDAADGGVRRGYPGGEPGERGAAADRAGPADLRGSVHALRDRKSVV